MARIRALDYDERREAIVEASAELFARKGFHATSVYDLAEICGMSKSLIYHYFDSKEDILVEAMTSHLAALEKEAETQAALEAPPEVRLRALTRRFMSLYSGAAARHKVMLNELDNLPPNVRASVVRSQRYIIRVVETLLMDIVPALKRNPRKVYPSAMLFFGMINWTHTWYRSDGPLAPEAFADMVVTTLLHGLPELNDKP